VRWQHLPGRKERTLSQDILILLDRKHSPQFPPISCSDRMRIWQFATIRPLKPNGRIVLRICIAMTVATSCAVALRFVAKRRTKTKLFVEDWLIIAGLILYYAYMAVMMVSKYYLKPYCTIQFCARSF